MLCGQSTRRGPPTHMHPTPPHLLFNRATWEAQDNVDDLLHFSIFCTENNVDYLLQFLTFFNHIVHIFNHIGSETVDIQAVSVGFGSVPILIASEEASFPIRHFHRFGFMFPLQVWGSRPRFGYWNLA